MRANVPFEPVRQQIKLFRAAFNGCGVLPTSLLSIVTQSLSALSLIKFCYNNGDTRTVARAPLKKLHGIRSLASIYFPFYFFTSEQRLLFFLLFDFPTEGFHVNMSFLNWIVEQRRSRSIAAIMQGLCFVVSSNIEFRKN